MTPGRALTDKPVGSPVAPKLVGLLLAVIEYPKVDPTVPLAVELLLMTGAEGTSALIVKVIMPLAVPPELVAVMVTANVPEAVGVPEITPVDVLTDKPEGTPEAP